MTVALPAGSVEYVKTTVTASEDPTSQPPEFAFTTTEAPTVWIEGEWVDDTTYDARILVGPGTDVELDPGVYFCWLRITDNPEAPQRVFDGLRII
jgi:hypothetical protein